MKIIPLSEIAFEELVDCFLKAFEGYFVSFPKNPDYFKNRWEIANVNYDLSYGMLENETLIGFIIHAIGERDGELTAYNTGTGVLANYRGRGIVNALYQFAIPKLKEKSLTRTSLEVIRENNPAIRAYKKIGFEVCKNYKCFRGNIRTNYSDPLINEVNAQEFNWNRLPNQDLYSWDNQKTSIMRGNYSFYQVQDGHGDEVGAFVMNPKSGYLAQFDCFENTTHHWDHLFKAIRSISHNIIVNNVEESLSYKIEQLKRVGLDHTIDQFEMEKSI